FAFHIDAMKGIGNTCSAGGLQTDDPVDFGFLGEQRGNSVVSESRITLVVDGLRDLDAGRFLESVVHTTEAFLEIQLAGNGDHHDLALALENGGHATATFLTGAEA